MRHFDRPNFIQFFPTLRCNRACSLCFNRGVETRFPDVTCSGFSRLINVLAEAGIGEIDFLGGEPTLHPDIFEFVGFARQRDIHVFLSSNGSDVKLLNRLSRAYDKEYLTLGISMNGESVSAELHDFIIKRRPLIKWICTKNLTMPETVSGYLKAGMQCFMLFPDTIFTDDLKAGMPFPEFFRRLETLKKTFSNLEGVYCSGFIGSKDEYPGPGKFRCPAGSTKLSVLPDGSVYPCYLFFRNNEFRIGNILEDSFQDIWENPLLNRFREFGGNRCPDTGCLHFSSCRGGCPAINLLINRSPDGPDPRCAGLAS
jgi:radical SAM protein with 4Fe4S-binding SPASM domain